MELLDIVDESDRVVGQAFRDEIHSRGLIHRSTHMLLFDSSGKLFFQRRSFQKDNDPGLWDSSAAGHVDAGESYLVCAVRELREELGIEVDDKDLTELFKLPPREDTGFEFATVFSLCSDQELTLNPEEIIDGKWLELGDVDQWVASKPVNLSRAFSIIWQKCQEMNIGGNR